MSSRRTHNRQEARANRKLQLIVSNSFPGLRGKTLLDKMEDVVDTTRRARVERAEEQEDEEDSDYIDWMLKNEGQIQGMLKMIAIMRSTSMKDELERSKVRLEDD